MIFKITYDNITGTMQGGCLIFSLLVPFAFSLFIKSKFITSCTLITHNYLGDSPESLPPHTCILMVICLCFFNFHIDFVIIIRKSFGQDNYVVTTITRPAVSLFLNHLNHILTHQVMFRGLCDRTGMASMGSLPLHSLVSHTHIHTHSCIP